MFLRIESAAGIFYTIKLNYDKQTLGISVSKENWKVTQELDNKECWIYRNGVRYEVVQ